MEKPSMEMIDKLFKCMAEFYGERWTKLFTPLTESFHKTMWQSALYGCTYEQIRAVLVYLKRAAQNPLAKPPHQLEFWNYIHSKVPPTIDYSSVKPGRSEAAQKAFDEINSKLQYRKQGSDKFLRKVT